MDLLTAAFVAGLPERCLVAPRDAERVARPLRDAAQSARAAWPKIEVPDEVYVRWLAQRIPEGRPVLEGLAALRSEEIYLACGCALSLPEALRALEHTFFAEILPTLVRITRSSELHDEVAQRLRERLFLPDKSGRMRLEGYAGQGAFRGWIRATIARIVLNLVPRRREIAVEDVILDAMPAPGVDPEYALVKQDVRTELKAAVREALERLEPRDRTVLRQAFVDGLGIDELGLIHGVHRATAARWITRIRQSVVESVRVRLGESHGALPVFESSFEVSMERCLAGG